MTWKMESLKHFKLQTNKNMTYFGQKKIVWNHKLYQEAIEAWKALLSTHKNNEERKRNQIHP